MGQFQQQIRNSVIPLLMINLCLIFAISAHAAPVLELTTDNKIIDILPFTDAYITTEELTIEEISRPPLIQKFTPTQKDHYQFHWQSHETWLRFSPKHLSLDETDKYNRYWLEIYPLQFEITEVYLSQKDAQGEWITEPIDATFFKTAPSKLFELPLVDKKDYLVFIKVSTDTPSVLSLKIGRPLALAEKHTYSERMAGLALGALLVLAALAFIGGAILRFSPLFSLSLYLLSICGLMAWGQGYIHALKIDSVLAPWLLMVIDFAGANFALYHFSTLIPSTNKFLINLQRVVGVGLVAPFPLLLLIEPNQILALSIGVFLSLSIILMIKAFLAFTREQDHSAFFLLASKGWMPLAIIAMLLLNNLTFPALPRDTPWLIPILIWETTAIFAALMVLVRNKQKIDSQKEKELNMAAAASRNRSEILGRLSHEIRTPMSGILGMTELLRDTSLSPTQKDFVDTIQNSGQALLNLIGEIIDKPKSSWEETNELTSIYFNLNELIDECLQGFRNRNDKNKFEFICDIDTSVPDIVRCDPTQLRQVILQILSAAFQERESGDIIFKASAKESTEDKEKTCVTFIATWHTQKKNIQQYEKGKLNLSVAKQISRLINGKIKHHSKKDKQYCRFRINLEVDQEQTTTPEEEKMLQHSRILIVDDNPAVCEVTSQQISRWGATVDIATNGKEALAKILAQHNIKTPYDIVITDQNMPSMNGTDLAKKIGNAFDKNTMPALILFTASSNPVITKEAHQVGIECILLKPITGSTLRITLMNILRQRMMPSKPKLTDIETEQKRLKGKNVLLAEDNPVSAQVISTMLKRLNVECTIADNGQQALETLRRGNFDLALMDCEMPLLDGYEATRLLRRWEIDIERPPIPVIALTAHIMEEHREKSFDAGMDYFLSKPVNLEQLKAALLLHFR